MEKKTSTVKTFAETIETVFNYELGLPKDTFIYVFDGQFLLGNKRISSVANLTFNSGRKWTESNLLKQDTSNLFIYEEVTIEAMVK